MGGSELYGAKVKNTDDLDIYGVYLEPPELVLGRRDRAIAQEESKNLFGPLWRGEREECSWWLPLQIDNFMRSDLERMYFAQ